MTYRSREAFKNSGVWISPSMQLFYFLTPICNFKEYKTASQTRKSFNIKLSRISQFLKRYKKGYLLLNAELNVKGMYFVYKKTP